MASQELQIEKVVVGPLLSNCYIVWDEETSKGIVIDPGDDPGKILRKINMNKLEIEKIIITHGHFDHIGAIAPLKKELGADFLAHKEDLFFIEQGKDAAKRWGLNIDQPPSPDRFIEDGEEISLGRFNLKVLHTPGHSPGGVSFFYDKIIFSGDTLFQGSIGRTDFRKGSLNDLIKSIKDVLYRLPDDTIVYTGHGPYTTIGDEKKFNAFVRL
jgi:glyoxylase-like metal-dependent hydrolase (beta-lactamase superfamily II)